VPVLSRSAARTHYGSSNLGRPFDGVGHDGTIDLCARPTWPADRVSRMDTSSRRHTPWMCLDVQLCAVTSATDGRPRCHLASVTGLDFMNVLMRPDRLRPRRYEREAFIQSTVELQSVAHRRAAPARTGPRNRGSGGQEAGYDRGAELLHKRHPTARPG